MIWRLFMTCCLDCNILFDIFYASALLGSFYVISFFIPSIFIWNLMIIIVTSSVVAESWKANFSYVWYKMLWTRLKVISPSSIRASGWWSKVLRSLYISSPDPPNFDMSYFISSYVTEGNSSSPSSSSSSATWNIWAASKMKDSKFYEMSLSFLSLIS